MKSAEQLRNRDPHNWTRRLPTDAELEALIAEDPSTAVAQAASRELRTREKEREAAPIRHHAR